MASIVRYVGSFFLSFLPRKQEEALKRKLFAELPQLVPGDDADGDGDGDGDNSLAKEKDEPSSPLPPPLPLSPPPTFEKVDVAKFYSNAGKRRQSEQQPTKEPPKLRRLNAFKVKRGGEPTASSNDSVSNSPVPSIVIIFHLVIVGGDLQCRE
ncbi:hypothetical protein TYRP_005316 [Tyrophagus putrescentiae]|nr:hypothetical protein TYRP_005316 [Tyrophagus putrescentiae]